MKTNINETITILKATQSFKLLSEGKLYHNKKSFVKNQHNVVNHRPDDLL